MKTVETLPAVVEPQQMVKAPITPAQAKIEAIANLTMKAYERASLLILTDDEVTALKADFPDDAFQTGAGGNDKLIYIEHAYLRDRFDQVFRPGQWALVPRSRWGDDFSYDKFRDGKFVTIQGTRIYVEAMLVCRGCFVAEAIGDMDYYKNNMGGNYGDAVEGAQSNALRRCAKALGVGLQAWKETFAVAW